MRGHELKAFPVAALLLLSLLWASASLRTDLPPGPASGANSSPFFAQAVLLAAFAIFSAAAALARKAQFPNGRVMVLSALAGIGLFVVPAGLIALAKGSIDQSTRVALFSLVPVFAVVLEPHIGMAAAPQRASLAAALVAVLGTMLVFNLEFPQTPAAAFAFALLVIAAASIAAANCVAVRIVTGSSVSILYFAAVVTGSPALILGVLSAITERNTRHAFLIDPWRTVDLLGLALLFWLMRRMTAVRMTTRFLIAPLLANLIGLAFLWPGVQLRGWLGLSLITLGSGWLLLAPVGEPEQTGSSLGIYHP